MRESPLSSDSAVAPAPRQQLRRPCPLGRAQVVPWAEQLQATGVPGSGHNSKGNAFSFRPHPTKGSVV